MKNFEKYMDEYIKSLICGTNCDFRRKHLSLEPTHCMRYEFACKNCDIRLANWFAHEYKPQIDWSKVPVDTPVIVKERSGVERKRHFCKYEKDHYEPFVCFNSGYTSFTGGTTTSWDNCELARPEDIEKYSI